MWGSCVWGHETTTNRATWTLQGALLSQAIDRHRCHQRSWRRPSERHFVAQQIKSAFCRAILVTLYPAGDKKVVDTTQDIHRNLDAAPADLQYFLPFNLKSEWTDCPSNILQSSGSTKTQSFPTPIFHELLPSCERSIVLQNSTLTTGESEVIRGTKEEQSDE